MEQPPALFGVSYLLSSNLYDISTYFRLELLLIFLIFHGFVARFFQSSHHGERNFRKLFLQNTWIEDEATHLWMTRPRRRQCNNFIIAKTLDGIYQLFCSVVAGYLHISPRSNYLYKPFYIIIHC